MTTTTAPEIKLPVWLAQDKNLPRYVSPVRLKSETTDAYLLDLGHVIRASDNCHRCGRLIDNAVSKLVGFGPDCSDKLGVPRPMSVADAEATLEALQQKIGSQVFTAWLPKRFVSADMLVGVPRDATFVVQKRTDHAVGLDATQRFFTLKFPYSEQLLPLVRAIPGAHWNGSARMWMVPVTSAANVAAFAEQNLFTMTDAASGRLPTPGELPPVQPVEPKRLVKLADGKLAFQFDYSQRTKDALKDAGARWNGERGDFDNSVWLLPLTTANATKALELIEEHGFTIAPDAAKALADHATQFSRSLQASSAEDVAGDFMLRARIKGTLRPYQSAGVQYMTEHMAPNKGVLNGDQMGLGKTIEAIALAEQTKAFPLLVVTTASTKFNWKIEFKAWTERSVAVLGSKDPTDPNTAEIVVINYDILGKHFERLMQRGFKMLIMDELQKIKNGDVAMLCVCGDQKHSRHCQEDDCDCREFKPMLRQGNFGKTFKVWEYKVKRVRLLKKLADTIPYRVGLSGTPIKNRPAEFVSILDILGRIRDFGGPKQFKDRYCDPQWDGRATTYKGASNLEELNTKLRATCYVRREKSQVLKELPPKTRQFVNIELSNRPEYDALEDVYADMVANSNGQDAAHLVRITELKQACARGKVAAIRDWMEDFFEQEDHLVLFCWHRETAALYAKTFNAPMIVGDTPAAKRQQIVEEFQAGKHRLLVANIQAGGEGITLTRSSNVAFTELAWTPGDHEQAEDRCHRMGQLDNVTAYYLLASDTVDDENWSVISKKWKVVDQALIGQPMSQAQVARQVETGILARVAARRGQPVRVKEESYAF